MYDEIAPTADELEPIARVHIVYEFRAFFIAAQNLSATSGQATAHPDDVGLAITRTILVETFLLHLRNITDFFATKATRDDVVAAHYAPTWSQASGGEALQWLTQKLFGINKRVAHLTAYRHRVPFDAAPVYVEEAVAHVRSVIDTFLSTLPPERRGWFDLN